MANKDAPFGARLVGKLGSGVTSNGLTEYKIASGASGNIFSGDLVKMTNAGTILVAAAGDESIGVFRGCQFTDSNGDVVFKSYFPDGTVSSDIVAFVVDDPNAVFEIQSAGSPAQTDVGLNADISYTAGSTKTGMSAVELSGTTAATTATFRIMGFSSDPDNSTTGSANVNVIVKFNETVALAFALTEEAVEDNLYDRLGARYTKALARSMANTKQIKAAAVLNNAFSTTGGDGKVLVATDHPLGGGGTLANRATTMADLNETSLEDALISISTFTDDRGLNIALRGMKLIVPPQLQFVADRLLQSPGRVGTSDNDINAVRNTGMLPDGYVVNHYLTDTDAFFLKTDCPDGFKYFERSPMQTALEGDFDTGNMRYKARERYSFGYSNFRAVFGSQGA
jgi:hypothetical protein